MDKKINEIESRYDIKFQPLHRQFLRECHTIDKGISVNEKGTNVCDHVEFVDWRKNQGNNLVLERRAALQEGLEFDVRHNGLWLSTWGERPDTACKHY